MNKLESNPEYNVSTFIHKTDQFVNLISEKSADEIALEYSYFTLAEHENFIKFILNSLNLKLSGRVLEAGAGAGVLSRSLVKVAPQISEIYLTDIVGSLIDLQKKITSDAVLDAQFHYEVCSFDATPFPDSFFDAVCEFDSFHHSEDLTTTLTECQRVLRTGGLLICFDRVHPDSLSEVQKDFLLQMEYSPKYKKKNNIQKNKSWRRVDNGEHEIRLSEWLQVMNNCGFDAKVYIFHKKSLNAFLRSVWGLFPFKFRKFIGRGQNLSTHIDVIANYFGLRKLSSDVSGVFQLNTMPLGSSAPSGKCVIVAKKR